MEGYLLYEMYEAAQLELNQCGVDSWEELNESEQAVWNLMAERIDQLEV